MIKLSSRMLLVILAISLCIGIGVGYAINDSKAGASDSDNQVLIDQLDDLNLTVEQLESQTNLLMSDLEEKNLEYEALLIDNTTTADDLKLVKEDLESLDEEYQDLIEDHQNLQITYGNLWDASENTTAEEVINLREQVNILQESVDKITDEKFWLDVEIARLNKMLTPSPDNDLERPDVWSDQTLWSHAYKGLDYKLQLDIEEIVQQYYGSHKYIEGVFDCNDMAVDLWNMLLAKDIKSAIVVGNRDMENETLEESDHAWLYVFNAQGKVIYVEPTTGQVFYGVLPDGTTNPKAIPYRWGYIYRQPSDLRMDLKDWW